MPRFVARLRPRGNGGGDLLDGERFRRGGESSIARLDADAARDRKWTCLDSLALHGAWIADACTESAASFWLKSTASALRSNARACAPPVPASFVSSLCCAYCAASAASL